MNTTAGLCECGCGGAAPIAKVTNRPRGYVAGQPLRFIQTHSARKQGAPLDSKYRIDDETGCWHWLGYIDKGGYGAYNYDGHYTSAHRAVWQLHYDITLPRHLQVDHLCQQRDCVNPAHLQVTTAMTNMRRRTSVRLSEADVLLIRSSTGNREEMAARFGISVSTLYEVRNGRTWGPDDTSEADHYNALAASKVLA